MVDGIEELDNWYANGYSNCYYSGPLKSGWGFVHRLMERPFKNTDSFPKVLEVGAGSGEHIHFVKHSWDQYILSDIRKPTKPIDFPKSNWQELDATKLKTIEDQSIDRLIATCLIAHLPNPYQVLKEWRRVVVKGGILTIYVPTEPSILLRVIRRAYIYPKARKHGLKNPKLMSSIDHPNHYSGIKTCLEDVFSNDQIRHIRFPVGFLGWNLSLFEIAQITLAK